MLLDMTHGESLGNTRDSSCRMPFGSLPPANTLGENRNSTMNRNFFLCNTLSIHGVQQLADNISLNHPYISGIKETSWRTGDESSLSRSDNLDFCSLMDFSSEIEENSLVIAIFPFKFVNLHHNRVYGDWPALGWSPSLLGENKLFTNANITFFPDIAMVKRYKTENPEIYPGLIILQTKNEFHQSVVSFIDGREIPLDVQFRHPHGLVCVVEHEVHRPAVYPGIVGRVGGHAVPGGI